MIKVTCALIIQQNKILIAQRGGDSSHPFCWEFPGGKIKPGETARQCIVREIGEELNVSIEILEENLVAVHFDYGVKKIELIPFICKISSGEIELREHRSTEWVFLKNLNDFNLAGADRVLIQNKINLKILEKYLGKNMNNP